MKKWLHQNQKIVAFVALVAIGLFVFTTRYPSSPEPTIPPVWSELPADTDQDKLVIIRTGVIENATLLPVNSGFAGKIVEVYVKNGQPVQVGQALFKLEYSMSAATKANDPTGAKKVDSERLKKLYEQGIISRREWENATGVPAPTPNSEGASPSPATSPERIAFATANAPIAGQPVRAAGQPALDVSCVAAAFQAFLLEHMRKAAEDELAAQGGSGSRAEEPEEGEQVYCSFKSHNS